MIIETSWDDGHILDGKVIELLKKYELPGTFYVVIDRIDEPNFLTWDEIIEIDKAGFEIGSHSMTHPADLKQCYDDQLHNEINDSKGLIESALDHEIKSFCYPRGRFDQRVIDKVIEAGYIEARTTVVGDIYVTDKLRKNTSVHVFNGRKEYNGKGWLAYAKQVFQEALDHDGGKYDETIFHLWGHSWEVEKYKLWGELEEFFKYVKNSNTK